MITKGKKFREAKDGFSQTALASSKNILSGLFCLHYITTTIYYYLLFHIIYFSVVCCIIIIYFFTTTTTTLLY